MGTLSITARHTYHVGGIVQISFSIADGAGEYWTTMTADELRALAAQINEVLVDHNTVVLANSTRHPRRR